MIRSSRSMKGGALVLALVAHGALALQFTTDEPVEVEGGAGANIAVLGNSFADLAVGTLEAPETPEVVQPLMPTQNIGRTIASPDEMRPLKVIEPQRPVQPGVTPPSDVMAALPQVPVAPQASVAVPVASPPVPEPSVTPAPTPTVSAQEPDSTAVTRSSRPAMRDRDVEARNIEQARTAPQTEEAPQRQERPQRQTAQPRGNAAQNATAGSATGQSDIDAQSAGSGESQNRAQGNAAASNYPGLVMRKISRVSKPRVGSRGTATVRFSIAGNGDLSGLSVARSSGNDRIDSAALQVVQRAAPFSPPPSGARRTFSIEIKAR